MALLDELLQLLDGGDIDSLEKSDALLHQLKDSGYEPLACEVHQHVHSFEFELAAHRLRELHHFGIAAPQL